MTPSRCCNKELPRRRGKATPTRKPRCRRCLMKWFRYFGTALLHLHPTAIDHEILACDCGTVFRRKKEHQFCNVLRNEFAFNALAPHYFRKIIRGHPQAAL